MHENMANKQTLDYLLTVGVIKRGAHHEAANTAESVDSNGGRHVAEDLGW